MSESANPSDPSVGRVAFSEALFSLGALRFGGFTLQDGRPSPHSIDLRIVPSDPEAYGLAVAAYLAVLKEIGESGFDAVAGAGTVGVAFSSPIAYLLKKPMLYVRTDYADAKPVQVWGAVRPGWRTVIIGDVADSGENLASTAECLRKAGCVVREAVVLVDRLEGGKAKLKTSGVRLSAFTDVWDVVQILYDLKKIRKAEWLAVRRQTERRGQ